MSTRRSVVILFALLDLQHEIKEDSFVALRNSIQFLAKKNKPSHDFVSHGIKQADTFLEKTEQTLKDLEHVLVKHPSYIPGSIARMALKPMMEYPEVYSQESALQWTKPSRINELNFLVSLLSLITGPRSEWFRSSRSRLDYSVILLETFQCVVDYEEEFGPDISSNFFHQCVIHFKTVKSEDFYNT